jgi:hypothetical protein
MEAPITPVSNNRVAIHTPTMDSSISATLADRSGYWVFAAYPRQWATIHRAGCSHCRGGRGHKGSPARPTTSDWLGPFADRSEAFARADKTGLKTVKGCGHCRP